MLPLAATLLYMAVVLLSCKPSAEVAPFEVTIRLPNEPESLHPIFSKSIYASQIESLILLPIAEYDPVSMSLSPLLITEIPVGEKITEGKHSGGKVFQLHFRPEAAWADGKPVTGEDYLFTFKSVYNPYVNAGSWKSFMDFISEIVVDPNDPKHVSVYIDSTYILELEATTNFNLYPAHTYDPENIMSRFTLEELRETGKTWTAEQDSVLKRFATLYESPAYFRETVSGSGPYQLDQWMTGEFIRLKRKDNWWGDALKDPPLLLQAYPSAITYRIILDEAAAAAALKAGELDLIAEVPVSEFAQIQKDDQWKDKLQFATPALMQVNYIEVNNRDSILSDKRIRKALAYTIDYNGIINNVLQGLAKRAVGPIHPDKPYFDKALKPLDQDINAALALVKEAGWSDSNGNGIPDKMIGGKRQELHLEIKVTNKEEGMAIANIVKENAAKAGFDIQIAVVDPSQLQQDVRQNNFQLLPLRIRAFPSVADPFPIWHASNDRQGGTNRSGFHNAALDSVIEDLRTTENSETRSADYQKFQEIIYEEQPAIFLYVPLERIIASKRIQLQTSARRPGYFENLMKPSGS
mgnify:CR=1 FL=1